MPRKKIATPENLHKAINAAKKLKKLQSGRFKVGERNDGQPIYHYPKITKVLLAKKLGISANYLTILQKRDEDIARILKYIGQPRPGLQHYHGDKPNPGTKAYIEQKAKRLAEENTTLKKKIKSFRLRRLEAMKNKAVMNELQETLDRVAKELKEERDEVAQLKSEVTLLKMKNSSLNAQLTLKNP